jgi:hypothetical protein
MYALVINGAIEKYPYSLADLRNDNPQVSFPFPIDDVILAGWNVFPVAATTAPEIDYTKVLTEGAPVFDGVWKQTWVITDNPDASQVAERLRAKAYQEESDPVFFKSQRGEATKEEWLAKVFEIKSRYP